MASKEKDQEFLKKRVQALVNNRMNLAPEGIIFSVCSLNMEDAIEQYLEACGIELYNEKTNRKDIVVHARPLKEFETAVKRGQKPDCYPFEVVVALRPGKKDDAGNHLNPAIRKIMRGMSDSERGQFELIGEEKLAKALANFAALDKHNKIKWEEDRKLKNWFACTLDTFKVLEYMFCDENNKNYIYDFTTIKTSYSEFRRKPIFVAQIVKIFERDNYKNRNRDDLDFLNR